MGRVSERGTLDELAGAGGRLGVTRRGLLASAAAAGVAMLGGRATVARQATPAAAPLATPVAGSGGRPGERWVATWAAAPHGPFPAFEGMPDQTVTFDDQTVRQIVRASAGGERVRVRLSNALGEQPLAIGAARLALRDADERIVPESDRALTFGGATAIDVPAGAIVLSDPVDLAFPALAELAVSIYLPEETPGRTLHGLALTPTYVSPAGDFAADAALPVETTTESWYFLAGIDVAAADPIPLIVAFGDSITDGFGATSGSYGRWPDVLAERLAADSALGPVAVANAGIGGNQVLGTAPAPPEFQAAFGEPALARFDRDVLGQPGVTHLIVLEGINDIGMAALFGDPAAATGANEIIGGLWQLAQRAREHGISPIGGTLTPYEGAQYFSPAGEATRSAVNEWIRTGGAFDAVIDFDAATRDPAQPSRMLPEFDPGDHLHFNDAGYRAMGEAIDLALFAAD